MSSHPAQSEKVPANMRSVFDEIVKLTDAFCEKRLNQECADMARVMAAALARKRPSPLPRGKRESWACGIVHAMGWANFLFDPSLEPSLQASEVWTGFGVSEATAYNKSKAVRDALKMQRLDADWCLPSRMDANPLIWILEVNGLLMDIRRLPREAQAVAFEKGLIPYIPADYEEEG